MNAARASFSPPPKPAHLRPHPTPSTANTHSHYNGRGDHEATRGGGPQRLSPQEAALRGASLAFQKQKEQSTVAVNSDHHNNHHNNNARVSRQTTGSSTVSAWEAVEQRERERERQALFLSPSSASSAATRDAHLGHGVAAPQIGKDIEGTTAATPPPSARKSASFIAATLAVSRSNTPVHSGTVAAAAAGDGGSGNGGGTGGGGISRASSTREPAEAQRRVRRRRGSSAVTSPKHSSEDLTDTTSLAPAVSLISLFEHKGGAEKMEPRKRASRPGSPEKPRPQSAYAVENRDGGTDDCVAQEIESSSTTNRSKPSSVPKPKPRTKTRVREQTPSPPLDRRGSPSIVSPKPRRPDTLPQWESTAKYDDIESSNVAPKAAMKPKQMPKVPKPRGTASRRDEGPLEEPLPTMAEENRKVEQQQPPKPPDRIRPAHVKERPPAPRKSAELSRRMPLSPKVKDPRIHDVAHTDGQHESTMMATESIPDARPSTADSKSSNDSFVSASSVPTRDETDSLHTMGRSTPSSTTPRPVISRPRSAQQSLVAPPIRRSVTGSSQLPLEALSDAIVAGSLASARHHPLSAAEGRIPPPAPPPRRQAQRRMKHTLRQPKAMSDDEDARRPHHRKGLNNKKHAHHEGSRRRWRDEITEREKKRYEAVWASNRGLFLVQPQQQHQQQQQQQQQSQNSSGPDLSQRPQLATQQNHEQPVRSESYEELSECVANVVVRDIWSRSRLPPAELAEVWDLVYGYARIPVHAALTKQEFVVGMWLIDQRLRGRKIPPRVSESVWGSAKGVRVLSPGKAEKHHHHHHHYHPHRPGHHKAKAK